MVTVNDVVEIINYGHASFITKKDFLVAMRKGETGGKAKPDYLIKENEFMYYVDSKPELVGKIGIVKTISKFGNNTFFTVQLIDGKRTILGLTETQLKKCETNKSD